MCLLLFLLFLLFLLLLLLFLLLLFKPPALLGDAVSSSFASSPLPLDGEGGPLGPGEGVVFTVH
jgi:hypothetical protein